MFDLARFPRAAQDAFAGGPLMVWEAVGSAIDGGASDLDDLTSLAFFINHPERMHGKTADPLDAKEPGFKRLADEWKNWRALVKPILDDAPSRSAKRSKPATPGWPKLTAAERLDLC